MKLSRDQTLALQAALLPTAQAVKKWNELVGLTDIEELDSSITRILPAVFQNLRGAHDVDGHAKLKGSHLFTWAKNTEFASAIKPLLQSLEKSQIDYRILKGGAINFLLGALASRSMGDIDILVSREGLVRFQQLLEAAGFSRKFAKSCPHVMSGNSDQELNYVNSENIEIDLHVMEDRRPALLFRLMMTTPPRICESMGTKIKIPSPELLILHAIFHGNIGVQSSDQIQSLLDTFRLLAVTDHAELARLSEKLHFSDVLESYLLVLRDITGENLDVGISGSRRIWHRINYRLSNLAIFLERFKDFSAIRASRSVEKKTLVAVLRHFPGRRTTYAIWLFLGKLRPLERFFISRFGGFLSSPQSVLLINQDSEYSSAYSHKQVQFNPFSGESQDWRFAFTTPPGTHRISVIMRSKTFAEQGFLIFINGLVGGVTDRNPDGSHRLEILNPAHHVEISLRLPANGCELCARKLSDLVLQFT
jgi:hypothetical protein